MKVGNVILRDKWGWPVVAIEDRLVTNIIRAIIHTSIIKTLQRHTKTFNIHIRKDVCFTQMKGCKFCLHIRQTAIYFGSKKGSGAKVELFTPDHIFKFTKATN